MLASWGRMFLHNLRGQDRSMRPVCCNSLLWMQDSINAISNTLQLWLFKRIRFYKWAHSFVPCLADQNLPWTANVNANGLYRVSYPSADLKATASWLTTLDAGTAASALVLNSSSISFDNGLKECILKDCMPEFVALLLPMNKPISPKICNYNINWEFLHP